MKFEYMERIQKLLGLIEVEEKQKMEEVTKLLTACILEKKSIFVFGASHAGIISQELFYRAGGLVTINPVFARELMLDTEPITFTTQMERLIGYGKAIAHKTPIQKEDLVFIHSVSGRNPVTIEFAIEAKRKGATIVAITNLAYSQQVVARGNSEKKLYEVSDIVIDNHGEKGDACIEIPGSKQKIAPTSSMAAIAIMDSIIAESVRCAMGKGLEIAPIFYSANVDGGDELNQKVFEKYKDVIWYKY